ncbi:GWxTD domain-containing protein [Caldithrix abyssi]
MIPRIIIWILVGSLFLAAQQGPTVRKLKTRYGFTVDRLKPITYQLFVHRTAEWKPVIYLAVDVQHDILSFVKTTDGYVNKFRVSVAIRDDKGNLTNKNSWDEQALLKNFEDTNSKVQFQYRLYQLKVFDADWSGKRSGRFQLYLSVNDLVANNVYSFKHKFTIDSVEKKWASTEIAFLKQRADSARFPLMGRDKVLRFSKPAWAFVRLKNPDEQKLTFNLRIYQEEKQGHKLFYQQFLEVEGQNGLFDLQAPLPMDSLDEGSYLLRISCKEWHKERKFKVFWFEKPTYLYRYDLAIRPMRLILDKKTYKYARSLSYDELEKWFKQYWKKRDPSKGTVYNEIMAEFFRRVEIANKRYSNRHREGWETDRGRIYILYGEPKEIDDHRYATETKPYQIWVYSDSLQFMFVDKNLDGEFELVNEEK